MRTYYTETCMVPYNVRPDQNNPAPDEFQRFSLASEIQMFLVHVSSSHRQEFPSSEIPKPGIPTINRHKSVFLNF